jgi:hypothetical protein
LALYGKDSDPRTNDHAKPVIETAGESLVFLRKDRKSGDWSMEHRGLRLSEMTSSVFLVQRLIRTILQVGMTRFVTKAPPTEPIHLAETTPGKVFSAINLAKGLEIRDFTIPLGWSDTKRQEAPPRWTTTNSETLAHVHARLV